MPHSDPRGSVLLSLARSTLVETIGGHARAQNEDDHLLAAEPWLCEPGACFVTLRCRDTLCGCIGSVEATRPLIEDVRDNAVAAALRDPRFASLTSEQLRQTEIEISLLSPTEPIQFASEADLLAELRPGTDGLTLRWREHKATLLPQVWDSLPKPLDFLACLKEKAGLGPQFWHPDIEIQRYTVQSWREGTRS